MGTPYDPERGESRAEVFERMSTMGRSPGRTRVTVSRVRSLRIAKGLTQAALGVMVGTNVATIRKAERGLLTQFRVSTILRIANALDCGASDCFPILGPRLNQL